MEEKEEDIMQKRDFLKASALAAGGVLAAPAIHAQQPVRWRFQTYAGAALGEHLKGVVLSCIESGHFYRNQWYWGGEAKLRAEGTKLKLRSIPAEEWREVENAADEFWQEVSETGETANRIVSIFRQYRDVINAAGVPYSFV
jgi:hypothetical protein